MNIRFYIHRFEYRFGREWGVFACTLSDRPHWPNGNDYPPTWYLREVLKEYENQINPHAQ